MPRPRAAITRPRTAAAWDDDWVQALQTRSTTWSSRDWERAAECLEALRNRVYPKNGYEHSPLDTSGPSHFRKIWGSKHKQKLLINVLATAVRLLASGLEPGISSDPVVDAIVRRSNSDGDARGPLCQSVAEACSRITVTVVFMLRQLFSLGAISCTHSLALATAVWRNARDIARAVLNTDTVQCLMRLLAHGRFGDITTRLVFHQETAAMLERLMSFATEALSAAQDQCHEEGDAGYGDEDNGEGNALFCECEDLALVILDAMKGSHAFEHLTRGLLLHVQEACQGEPAASGASTFAAGPSTCSSGASTSSSSPSTSAPLPSIRIPNAASTPTCSAPVRLGPSRNPTEQVATRKRFEQACDTVLAAVGSHLAMATTVHFGDELGWGTHCAYGVSFQYFLAAHVVAQVVSAEQAVAKNVNQLAASRGGGTNAGARGSGDGASGSSGGGGTAAEPNTAALCGLAPELLPPPLCAGCGGCNRPDCPATVSALKPDYMSETMRYWVRVMLLGSAPILAHDQLLSPRAKYAVCMRGAAAAMAAWEKLYSKRLVTPGAAAAEDEPAAATAGAAAAAAAPAAAPRERPMTQKQLRQAQQQAVKQQQQQQRGKQGGQQQQPQSQQGPQASSRKATAFAGTFQLEDCPTVALDTLICAAGALQHAYDRRRANWVADAASDRGVGERAVGGAAVSGGAGRASSSVAAGAEGIDSGAPAVVAVDSAGGVSTAGGSDGDGAASASAASGSGSSSGDGAAAEAAAEDCANRGFGRQVSEPEAGLVLRPREWWQGAIRALQMVLDLQDGLVEPARLRSTLEMVRVVMCKPEDDNTASDSSSDGNLVAESEDGVRSQPRDGNCGASTGPKGDDAGQGASGSTGPKGDDAGQGASGSTGNANTSASSQRNPVAETQGLGTPDATRRRVAPNMAVALPLGLLPCLEAVMRRGVPPSLAVSRPPNLQLWDAICFWADLEPLLVLAGDLRQALSLVVSRGKLMSLLVSARAMGCDITILLFDLVPLRLIEMLASLTPGTTGPATAAAVAPPSGRDDTAVPTPAEGAGAASAASPAPAPAQCDALPPTGFDDPPQQSRQRSHLQYIVSLAVMRWAPAAMRVLGLGQAQPGLAGAGHDCVVRRVLQWVPVLCRSYQLAAERGDTRAAAGWRQLLLVDINCFDVLDSVLQLVGARSCFQSSMDLAGPVLHMVSMLFPEEMAEAEGKLCKDWMAKDAAGKEKAGAAGSGGGGSGKKGAGGRRTWTPSLQAVLRALLGSEGCKADPVCLRSLELIWAGPAAAAPVVDLTGAAGLEAAGVVDYASTVAQTQAELDRWTAVAELLVPPHELAAVLPVCANPACLNLDGDSEARLPLPWRCGKCNATMYCSRGCQAAHAQMGHTRGVCAAFRGL